MLVFGKSSTMAAAAEEDATTTTQFMCDVCEQKITEPCRRCPQGAGYHCKSCCIRAEWQKSGIYVDMLGEHACVVCGKLSLLRCSKCRVTEYCSRRCQRSHWDSAHKNECTGIEVTTTPDSACGIEILPQEFSCSDTCGPGIKRGANRTVPLAKPDFRPEAYEKNFKYLFKKSSLGKGSYGSVSRVILAVNAMAVKTFDLDTSSLDRDITEDMLRESEARNVNHPNVAAICFASVRYEQKSKFSKQRVPAKYYLGMDEAWGSLSKLLKSEIEETLPMGGPFSSLDMKLMAYQLLCGIAALHSQLITHNDIKDGNTLVYGVDASAKKNLVAALNGNTTFVRLAIADFGLSRGFYTGPYHNERQQTYNYSPPEFMFGTMVGTYAGDVWAAACVLYELATGEVVFSGETTSEIQGNVRMTMGLGAFERAKDVVPPMPKEITPNTQAMPKTWYRRLYPVLSKLRLALNDAKLVGLMETEIRDKLALYPGLHALIKRMLTVLPEERCTIFEALDDPYFDAETKVIVDDALGLSKYPIQPIRYDKRTFMPNPRDVVRVFLDKEIASRTIFTGKHEINEGLRAMHARDVHRLLEAALEEDAAVNYTSLVYAIRMRANAIVRRLEITKAMTDGTSLVDDDNYIRAALILAEKYLSDLRVAGVSRYIDSVPKGAEPTSMSALVSAQYSVWEELDFDVTMPTCADYFEQYALVYKAQDPVGADRKLDHARELLEMMWFSDYILAHYTQPELAAIALAIVYDAASVDRYTDVYDVSSADVTQLKRILKGAMTSTQDIDTGWFRDGMKYLAE